MRYVSTAVIVALTTVMAVYAVVQGKPGKKTKSGPDRVFADFAVKKATKVRIEKAGQVVELVRKGKDWMLTSPSPFPADSDAVETLLADMEMLTFTRKLDADEKARVEYGLDKPKVSVSVEGALPGGAVAKLRLGAVDVTGRSLYVSAGDGGQVLVVDKGILSSADKNLDQWRSKRAFLIESSSRVQQVSYDHGGKGVHLKKRDAGVFLVDSSGKVLCRAQRDAADDMWRRIDDLKIIRFVAAGKGVLAKHSLGSGWIEVVEVKKGTTSGKAAGSRRHRLLFGGTCKVSGKTYDNEVLAGRPSQGGFPEAVFCVKARELQALVRPEAELRDLKLLAFQTEDLRRVEIRRSGRKLVLLKTDQGWKISEPKQGKGVPDRSDGELIARFIDDVQAFNVLAFSFPGSQQQQPGAFGLDKPTGALVLENSDGLSEELLLGATDGDNLYVRRKGEAAVLTVHKELAELLRPDPLAFRDRQVLSLDQGSIKKVVIQSGPVTEELTQKDGRWHLSKPVDLDADQDAMDGLLRALSSLRADKYLPQGSGALAALNVSDARVIRVLVHEEPEPSLPGKQAGGKDKTKKAADVWYQLRVGGDFAGGCAARLDKADRPSFLLPMSACRDLRALLVDRRLVDVTPSQVRKIHFVGPKGQWELEKKGPQWYSKAGPKVDNTSVETLLTTVQGLRATRAVHYGKPTKEEGGNKPYLTVTVTTDKGAAVSIVVGSEVHDKDGKVTGRFVWRADRAVVYLLPEFSVRDLEKTSL